MPEEPLDPHIREEEPFDFSYVATSARVALYDDMKSAPRVTKVDPAPTARFIENLADCIYSQAKSAGGSLSYTIIREVAENFIHARFKEIVVSILDDGNTIRFADQGPGIEEKEKAQEPGFTSATEEMADYIRGVGSGLPIVRDYIDERHGTISIEDNLKQGSVITISLKEEQAPLHRGDVPTSHPRFIPVQPLSDREKAILQLIYEEGPLGVTDISRETESSASTVHSNLARLEQAGLIEKGPGKKRSITEIGSAAAEQLART